MNHIVSGFAVLVTRLESFGGWARPGAGCYVLFSISASLCKVSSNLKCNYEELARARLYFFNFIETIGVFYFVSVKNFYIDVSLYR